MPVFKSCTSVPHPSLKTGACKAKASRQSGRVPRGPLPQAKQSRGCTLSPFYTSITPASPLALLQCPYLPRPGGPSLLMPRHSLHFPTVPPAPLPAQLVMWLPLHTAHTCPPCPPGPFPKPQLVPSTLVPAGHQPTARLVLSVPCSPFPSHLVQAVSLVTCTLPSP